MEECIIKIGFSIEAILGDDESAYVNRSVAKKECLTKYVYNKSDAKKIPSEIESIDQRNVLNTFKYSSLQNEHNQSNFLLGESDMRRSKSPSPRRSNTNEFMNLHAGPIRPHPTVPQNMIKSQTIPPYINWHGFPQVYNSQYMHCIAGTTSVRILAQRQAEHGCPNSANFGSHPPHLVNSRIHCDCWWPGRIIPHEVSGNSLHQFRKPKQARAFFTSSQLLTLRLAYAENIYLGKAERKALAQTLNVAETRIRVWFQNRRDRRKKKQQKDNSKAGNVTVDNDGST